MNALQRSGILAGLIFALHPVQTEAVTYVSGGSQAIATAFALLTILAFTRLLDAQGRASPQASWLALAVLGVTLWPASRLGTEFMPNLNEGTLFYMPTTLPGISITKAAELLQMQDRIIKSFPEVASVVAKRSAVNFWNVSRSFHVASGW